MSRPSLPSIFLSLIFLSKAFAEPVDFNREVRPILSDHCFTCHGPDAQQRQGELRLDLQEAAFAPRKGRAAIAPGKPDESEVWRRINSEDADERMPPKEGGRPLTAEQIATLKRWIEEGAKWQTHWAFTPPVAPHMPVVKDQARMRSPIDALVAARLEREGISPGPEADRPTLLRRITLDLTGLPPTPEEVAAFLNDSAPDAYERTVDKLLASPRYGERMAVRWLDAARYADTSGYQTDGERHMWRWRDWVIEAFNANMPFDRFTIEQLAGDLLENPTLDQRIATGFNRNHRGNAEGGIIPEEYAVEYVIDRVETTCTVWLGLTMGCVRCHDHKFDPFTQRDFYGLYAFFNNVPEKGRAVKIGNSPPLIKSPTRSQRERLTTMTRDLEGQRRSWLEQGLPRVAADLAAWEKTRPALPSDWQPAEHLVIAFPLESIPESGLEGTAAFAVGKWGQAATFDGTQSLAAGDVGNFGFMDKFTLSAWVKVGKEGGGTVLSRMTDMAEGDGYQLAIVKSKLQLNLSKRWLDDALRVESADSLQADGAWHHVAAVYDGSRVASGVKLYLDGRELKLVILLDELNQTFAAKQPLRIGGGGGPEGRFRGSIDEVRVYRGDLSPEHMRVLATPETLVEILAIPSERRSPNQFAKLQEYFLAQQASPELQIQYRQLRKGEAELREFNESLPDTMVMEELAEPRPTHILLRGQYDKPGERVAPALPTKLLRREPKPLAPDIHPNRLTLAQWLIGPDNPLTARVTVNRIWQAYFGAGLVKTTEDFGAQGDQPAYPNVLDWLAVEIRSTWDVKRLQRHILSSATYRQSSRASRESLHRDPENRLLARGPRVRLSAEMVRDQALFAGGLLVEELGGPSVKPRQPAGLWKELTGGDDYEPGKGADLVRRSLYTYWKRTIPPPAMTTFDAASREFCTVRESRTNTPLQALVLLNDQDYADAAVGAAVRVLRQAASEWERMTFAYRLVLGRDPTPAERQVIERSLARHRTHYQAHPDDAEKLLAANPLPAIGGLKVDDLAAWTAVCSTLLNLDEAVTKE